MIRFGRGIAPGCRAPDAGTTLRSMISQGGLQSLHFVAGVPVWKIAAVWFNLVPGSNRWG